MILVACYMTAASLAAAVGQTGGTTPSLSILYPGQPKNFVPVKKISSFADFF